MVGGVIEDEEEDEAVVFTRECREGIRSTRNTRNIDPFKPRTDESPALFHPYLGGGGGGGGGGGCLYL